MASLFLMVGAAWAQVQVSNLSALDNSKAYFLKNANDMGYAIWKSGNNLTLCGATSNFTDALDATAAGSNWQIIKYEEKYFLYNVGAQKFAVTQGGPTYLTETPTPISIESVNKGFAFNSDGESTHYMCASHQGHHASAPVQFWYSSDNGSAWQIIENNEIASLGDQLNAATKVQEYFSKQVTLTFQYKFSGTDEIVYTTQVKAIQGEQYTVQAPYFTSISSVTIPGTIGGATFTVPSSDATITVALKDEFPYKRTTLVDGEFPADAAWYVVKQNSTNKDTKTWKYNNGVYVERNEEPSTYTENHLWCFAGNVFDLKIYSKVAGATKVLSATNPASMAETNSVAWKVVESAAVNNFNGLNPFCLQKGEENSYLNISGDQLKYYGERDGGSTIRGIEAYTLTVRYMCGGEVLTDLNVSKVVLAGESYTIADSEKPEGYTISSCMVNGVNVELVDGAYTLTVNTTTEVVVTLQKDAPEVEPTDLYALKSVTLAVESGKTGDTYLNFTSVTTQYTTTIASFQSTPSFLYVKSDAGQEGVYLQSLKDANTYVGSNHDWLVTKDKSYWNISEPDTDGFVTISRSTNANQHLGHNEHTTVGYGIFTNVVDNCNKWQLLPAYPVTIKYVCADEELATVKDAAIAGESYTISNNERFEDYTILSCEVDGVSVELVEGAYTLTVNSTTEVVVTLQEKPSEPTNLYALQSPSGTFFNFTDVTPAGHPTTHASFQSEASFVYKIEEDGSYAFQSLKDATKYIGYNASAATNWITTTDKSKWTISKPDADGYVAISRSEDANKYLGHNEQTTVGTGIFTDVDNSCNRWKFLPAYPVTINYVCGEEALGTVKDAAIKGASFTAEIDLKGGKLLSCVDDQGATLEVTNNILSIAKVTAPITITVTLENAKEGGVVEIGDWEFGYEPATNGIKLTDVKHEGSDKQLVIASEYEVEGVKQEVVAISPDFLHGNTKVTSVTLPASLVNLGFRKVEPMFVGKYEGQSGDGTVINPDSTITTNGMNRCYIFPNDPYTGKPFMINEKTAWRLTLDVTIDNVTDDFNEFGSAIVSTKANSLDDHYQNHMQIYLHKGHQNIVVKMNNSDDRYKYYTYKLDENNNETSELLVNKHFKFELEHDGTGGYQIVIYYENGKAKMYNITADNNIVDFDRLYYSLPEGIHVDVKFDRLLSEGLFVGCTNLQEINVDANNRTFKSVDGVLYDKNGYYLMRIPEGVPAAEGETTPHFNIPSKVVKLYAGAIHGVKADVVLHSNPQIGVVAGHEEAVKGVNFYLSLDDKDNTIVNGETGYGGARDFTSANNNTYVGANYKRAPLEGNNFGTICLPFVPTNALDKYDFFKFKDGDETSFTFSQVESVADLEVNTAYLYKLKDEPGTMTTTEDGLDVFETDVPFTVQTHAKYNPNEEAPGLVRALGSYVNNYIETAKYPNSAYYYFSTSGQNFVKVTKKLNYRPYRAVFVVTPETEGKAAQAPAVLTLRLLDGTTTNIDASLVEGMETPVYYDLSGRRVLNPGSGVYIVNGKKVFIK